MKRVMIMSIGLAICGLAAASVIASVVATQRPPTQEARTLGVIDFGDDRTKDVVSAPTTVRVREDFAVKIATYGGGCDREGDNGVIVTRTGATVMVYDFTAATRPDVICAAVFKRLPHTVTLRFERPGEALIRIWGRRIGVDTPPLGAPTVLEHRVMVK
ncbi:MAG: hypothetical protein HYV01_02560 [Deltaproteobacteria bacterium]|nr:hypothetical protein [Deltaproteobacteria bacterium]